MSDPDKRDPRSTSLPVVLPANLRYHPPLRRAEDAIKSAVRYMDQKDLEDARLTGFLFEALIELRLHQGTA